MTDWKQWAQRKTGRGNNVEPSPVAAPPAPSAMVPAQQTLPPAPPGYAWTHNPSVGFVLIPLNQPAAIPAPLRQPGTVPYHATPRFTEEPVETCTLVRKGDRDTYAELLATIPDLVPPSQYDAIKGRPDPQVARELAGVAEYHSVGDAANPDSSTDAYPKRGIHAPTNVVKDLGSVPLPAMPDGLEKN